MSSEIDPYAPPLASLDREEPAALPGNLIEELHYGSTWKLLGFGVLTLGAYWAHYAMHRTRTLNNHLPAEQRISIVLVWAVLITSYLSTGLILGFFFLDAVPDIEVASNIADKVNNVVMLIWVFSARNRINTLIEAPRDGRTWFNGLWTFLFNALYINYKVNQLRESQLD